MLRTIHLHGDLEQFGTAHRLDVATVLEAVRALCLMVPGFRECFSSGSYRVALGADREEGALSEEEAGFALGASASDIHFIPVPAGSKDNNGFSKIILGAGLIAASFMLPASATLFGRSLGAMSGTLGVSIAFGGVSQLLANTGQSSTEQDSSDLFSGSPNQALPGSAIPVVFGESEVPIKIISSAIHLEDRA